MGQLIVVPNTIIKGKVRPDFPGVLSEPRHGLIADSANRIAEALNVVGRKSQAVLLHCREVGCRDSADRGECRYGRRTQSSKVVKPGKVQLENCRRYSHLRIIAAELERVIAGDKIQIVSPLVPSFRAHHGREKLTADESRAGNVESNRIAIF